MNILSPRAMRTVALAGVAATAVAAVVAHQSPLAEALREGRPIVGILFGTDLVDHSQHSDTLLWWRYNPADERLDVLSIPRDTRIAGVGGRRFRRINEVYTAQFAQTRDDRRASEDLRQAVVSLLGVAGTPLEPRRWVHVNYEGFRRFVDTVGGIRVHVDEPMHYDDKAGDLHIHYEPGDYVLSGSRSLEYVRFRGKSGDRGRILRQMDFFRALIRKTASPEIFLRWPRLLAVAAGGLRSNLSWSDILCLAVEAKHVRPERITPAILPGHPVGAEWAVDDKRLAYMMDQWGAVTAADPPLTGPLANKITIRVGNATRRQGLALSATRRLRAAGFDVVDWGDYNARQAKTRVVDRIGAIENARKVAHALGTDFVISDVDPSLRTDVEVILGDDYLEGDK